MDNLKIAIILDQTLEPWQACNVSAFLSSGIPANLKGQAYLDSEQQTYLALVTKPILIYATDRTKVKRTLLRANQRQVNSGLFTFEMFQTFNDQDNRQTVQSFSAEELNLAGLICFGAKKEIDKIIRGLHFYGSQNGASNGD